MSESSKKPISPPRRREIPGMFEGPMLPLLLKLALPMLLGMMVNLIYNITDTIFMSRIDLEDPSIIGGTGLIFPIIFFAMAIANGVLTGTSSLVARAIGARNQEVLSRSADSGIFLGLIMGLLIFIPVLFFSGPMVQAMGAEGAYFRNGHDYLTTINWVVIPMLLGQVLIGILQGEGQMNYVMKAMFIGTIGNILLDPVFIFPRGEFLVGVFGLGVKGAAWATVLAQTLSVVYLFLVFMRKKSAVEISFKVSLVKFSVMLEILRVGIPQTLGQVFLSLSFIIYNKITISVDPLAMTSFSLTGRMDNIILMPLFAIGAALVTMVGQNGGRGLGERVQQAWKTAVLTGGASTLFFATIMVLAAPVIYPFFSDVPQVIRYAVGQTRTLEYTFLGIAVAILGSSVFQGVGRPIPGLILVVIRLFVITVPLALIFAKTLGWGIPGIWYAIGIGNIFAALVGFFWINRMLKHHDWSSAHLETAKGNR